MIGWDRGSRLGNSAEMKRRASQSRSEIVLLPTLILLAPEAKIWVFTEERIAAKAIEIKIESSDIIHVRIPKDCTIRIYSTDPILYVFS
ncbi:hypothetical protein U1Q18_027639 [Sarracenia purpurea var. burkii]